MWKIKGLIRGILAIFKGGEWLLRKTHDDIFKNIKKQKQKSKENWCDISFEYFKNIKEGFRNTWENQMTNIEREAWLKLYGKDIITLIEELEMKEYKSRFKTI